jgi:enoyl-CoA hydratase
VIDLTRRGTVDVLRMVHGKANALDVELCEGLRSQLQACAQSDAGALVVTGDGTIFSAGVDLVRLVNGGAAYVRTFLPALNRLCEALFAFPKPLVAAVNGHAIAGGCIIACAADYRMMTRDPARIGIPELLVGVPFPPAPLEIMRFAAPAPQLQAMIFRGVTFTPDLALQRGLVDAVVDADRLLADAVAAAEAMAAVPVAAFALTKRQLREPALQRIRAGAAIDAEVEDAWASPAILRAVGDYVARTLKR